MSNGSEIEAEKRSLEESSLPTGVSKRRKLEQQDVDTINAQSKQKVNQHELASAFALASLATLSHDSISPGSNDAGVVTSNNSWGQNVEIAGSWEETRSPKATQAPTSPDQRSPGSPKFQTDSTMSHEQSPNSNRRVTFANGTKEQSSNPSSILKAIRQVPMSRRIILPPQRHGAFVPRGCPTFPMNSGFVTSPPVPPHYQLQANFPPMQPWFHHGRVYPPQRLMQPPLIHPENQWICDYCNVAAFTSYEEACVHEESCKIRCSALKIQGVGPKSAGLAVAAARLRAIPGNPSLISRNSSGEEESMVIETPVATAADDKWYTGTLSLAVEESDREWLSELNCFVREYCVEAFSASEDDVSRSTKRGRISYSQVGIRCRFCAHLPLKEKAVAAVSFPTSIAGIYESVKRWQRVHLEVCEEVPQEIRDNLSGLANTNVWVPTTRQYWSDSAKSLGLVDTNEGIRFSMNPKEIARGGGLMKVRLGMIPVSDMAEASTRNEPSKTTPPSQQTNTPTVAPANPSNAAPTQNWSDNSHIVFPDDIDMIPPYVYFLMRQVEPCHFTEADRFVARSKGPVGYPGFQCRHCNGHAGLGKYFPVSAKSLSTNSTSQNIHAHLLKCRKCPDQVKDRLVQLKIEKSRSPRLEPGWRKVFFDKVWGRLHG